MTDAPSQLIFVNLPVKDLGKSTEFFTKLGFQFDARFTDDNATCMIVSDKAFVMLLVEKFFSTFIKNQVCDTTTRTEAIIALSADSREQVDAIVDRAMTAGAQGANEPMDQGFMYSRSFLDLDGHFWEIIYMDMTAAGM